MSGTRTIRLDHLTRVEGEGSLLVRLSGPRVADVKLNIFEPPRLFEGILEGRSYEELPDIVARICGICPIAHQLTAIIAVECAFGIEVDPGVRALRRLAYLGEWISSHALHIYLLQAPDFLGCRDVMEVAREHRNVVESGLTLKSTGNALVALLGGRDIHPVSLCVGGCYRAPSSDEFQRVRERLETARKLAMDTVRFTAGLKFPDFEEDYEFVAVSHASEYAIDDGRVVSNRGLDIAAAEFTDHFIERQVAHSHALHSVVRGRGSYLLGPLARFNLNFERFHEPVRALAAEAGIAPPCRNPFRGIIVRSLELFWAIEEAIRLIDSWKRPDEPRVRVAPRAGAGHACTEAPRGLLYHSYELDDSGVVRRARIVPPTSQNQKRIEEDLFDLAGMFASLPNAELTQRCEQAIRNYDPCISCATHFLDVRIERE